MKEYLHSFMQKCAYPAVAQAQILADSEKVQNNQRFMQLVAAFYTEPIRSVQEFQAELDELSKQEGVNSYTLYLIFFLFLSKDLRKEYQKADLAEDIYWDTVADLVCKLLECFEVEKVWGITAFSWFEGIFHMRTIALGRMQYCLGKFGEPDATVAGHKVSAEDTVVYIHIPSSKKSFDRENRIASYEKAYLFYKDRFEDQTPIFCCDSWLLNPEMRTALGESSNIVSFMDDFKLVKSYGYTDNRNMWRIFGADADKPPSELPRNTSMQRKIADWLQEGNRLGAGKGLFVYDPTHRTTLK